MRTGLLVGIIVFIIIDLCFYLATPKVIRDRWPVLKIIPGGAIYYTVNPPKHLLHIRR